MMIISAIFISLILAVWPSWTQESNPLSVTSITSEGVEGLPEVVGDDWTEITCDGNMLANYAEGWVRFSRNVRVKNQRGTIFADLLVIFTVESGSKVDRAEARGNVLIVMGSRQGTGDSLIYYPEQKKAVLIGNATLKEGNNQVTGKSIAFYTDTRNVEIDRAREMEFHPRTEFELDF